MKPNPFLADNNIFSKVVNPIRKPGDKPQTPNGAATGPQIRFTPYQPIETNSQFQAGKISFGEPNQAENRYENKFENRAEIVGEDGKKRVAYDSRSGQQHTIGLTPSSPNYYDSEQARGNRFQKGHFEQRGAFQGEMNLNMEPRNEPISQFPSRKNPFIASKETGKPQTYASPRNISGVGRPEQLSPISKNGMNIRLEDSGFLNIEALDDDISRFLESNQNKEEMKKMLGMKPSEQMEERRVQTAPFKEAVRHANENRGSSPSYQPTIQQYKSRQGSRQTEQSYDYRPNPYSSLPAESKTSQIVTSLGQANVQSPDRYQLPSFKPLDTRNVPEDNSITGNRVKQEINRLAFQNGRRIFMTTAEKIFTVPYQLGPL